MYLRNHEQIGALIQFDSLFEKGPLQFSIQFTIWQPYSSKEFIVWVSCCFQNPGAFVLQLDVTYVPADWYMVEYSSVLKGFITLLHCFPFAFEPLTLFFLYCEATFNFFRSDMLGKFLINPSHLTFNMFQVWFIFPEEPIWWWIHNFCWSWRVHKVNC